MRTQEVDTALRISALMKTARKNLGLTQQAVAQRLGISQGALSKMEHAHLIPSAPQWFEFCELTGIPPYSLKLGTVEKSRCVKCDGTGVDSAHIASN